MKTKESLNGGHFGKRRIASYIAEIMGSNPIETALVNISVVYKRQLFKLSR